MALVAGSLAFAALFTYWEAGPARRRGYPLVDVRLFGIRSFSTGLGVGFLFFCAYNGLGLVLALYLQDGLGVSTGRAGLIVALYAVGTSVGALVAGRSVGHLGSRVLLVALALFGTGVAAAAAVAAAATGRLSTGAVVAALILPLLIAGLGGGGVVSPNQALALADLGRLAGSTAGGMLQTAQRVGNAMGAAIVSAAYYYVLQAPHPASTSSRVERYGHAYGVALLVSLLFGLAALALASFDVRRRPATAPALTEEGCL